MASCARKEIIREGQPGIFHVWNQCVRRAYLFGDDPLTGNNHNHRRDWVIQRLMLLTSCFTIDVGFFAVMSNHLHLVLRTTPRLASRWGSWELARRWLRVYPGKHVLDGEWVEPSEEAVRKLAEDKKMIAKIRKRLTSVSWFMAALSENVARRANHEDGCHGRFWSGRFACRELLNEIAILICGIYVDLNQIRAGEASTPETSLRTSVGIRIRSHKQESSGKKQRGMKLDVWLAPLTLQSNHLGDVPSTTSHRASDKGLIDVTFEQYVKIVDFAGRQARRDKYGVIPAELAPILERLGISDTEKLMALVLNFPRLFRRMAGGVNQLKQRAKSVGRQWFQGIRPARQFMSADQAADQAS